LTFYSPLKKAHLIAELSLRATKRREIKVNEQKTAGAIIPDIHQGSIPLIHPDLHNFRDEDPTKFLGPKTISNLKVLTSAERAALEQKKIKDLFLSTSEPAKISKPYEFRQSEKTTIIQPKFQYFFKLKYILKYRVKASHDNERIMEALKKSPKIDFEKLDTKMMYFHDFRPKNQEKWISDVIFFYLSFIA